MKKLVTLMIALMAMSGIAMAAPLTDYSPGNVQADIGVGYTYASPNAYGSGAANSQTTANSGYSVGAAVTFGVGKDFAVRANGTYSNVYPIVVGNDFSTDGRTGSLTLTQMSLLYQVMSPKTAPAAVSVYLGYDKTYYSYGNSTGISATPPYQTFGNGGSIMVGAEASKQVANNVTIFGNLEASTVRWGAGVGAAYNVNSNFDVNLGVNYALMNSYSATVYGSSSSSIYVSTTNYISPYLSLSFRM